MVLSRNSSLIPRLLHTFHDSIPGGHSGFLRTYKRMSGELFWKGMKADVKRYVEECDICQRNKFEATKPAGVLQPIPIPDKILEDWTMDFIEGLPLAGGYNVIMVVVDRLSKYSYFLPLKTPVHSQASGFNFFWKKWSANMEYPSPLLLTVIRSSLAFFGRSCSPPWAPF